MYKKNRNRQYCITDFDQPMGMKLDPENRWLKKAETIPWDDIEDKYAELFPSNTGMPAKPLRVALGSLLIQKKLGVSDRDLVAEITENPYLQYFIGLTAYQNKAPFAPSLLVEFRKRLPVHLWRPLYKHLHDKQPLHQRLQFIIQYVPIFLLQFAFPNSYNIPPSLQE